MSIDTQIRSKLLRKIQRIPSNRLKEIDDFISLMESSTNKKDKNLSFAGAWVNIDDSVFVNLTDNLIENREKNKRRINE
jgi:hypothetical protein